MMSMTGQVSFRSPIIIALGSNLAGRQGSSWVTLEAAVRRLRRSGIDVYRRSPWVRSTAQPPSPQGMFTNGVVLVRTSLPPAQLMAALHRIERGFGRVRRQTNAARVLDLDLIAYGSAVQGTPGGRLPVVPHPRAHQRAFVMQPLRLIAAGWRHPVFQETAQALLKRQTARFPGGVCFVRDRPLRPVGERLK